MKKAVSLLLILAFVLSAFPYSFAADVDETGLTVPYETEQTHSEIPENDFSTKRNESSGTNPDDGLCTAERTIEENYSSMVGTDDYLALLEDNQADKSNNEDDAFLRTDEFDNIQEFSVNPNVNADSSLKELFTDESLRVSGDLTGAYFALQGACTDGEYAYFSFLLKYTSTIVINARIVCAEWTGSAFEIRKITVFGTERDIVLPTIGTVHINAYTDVNVDLYHANDMTYNSYTGEIIVLCAQSGYHNRLYTIPSAKLRPAHSGETVSPIVASDCVLHYISCNATSIDFNKNLNCYFVGITTEHRYFIKLDYDFHIIEEINHDYLDVSTGDWLRHTVFCDNRYLYSVNTLSFSNNSYEEEQESKIDIYNLSGVYKKTIVLNCNKTGIENPRSLEAENLLYLNGKLFIFSNYFRGKPRQFCFTDLTDLIFNIQFCPDDNIVNYLDGNNNNIKQFIIRKDILKGYSGLSTTLQKQRINNSGYRFVGWTIYRQEVNKWYYKMVDGDDKGWYYENSQPQGYEKCVYNDMQEVIQTGKGGEHVLMCAQWEESPTFSINFFANGGSGVMNVQYVTHGILTPLYTNLFQKNNRTFQGWNAYWSELNKWYYKDTNSNEHGWYVEGRQPVGYKKYVYSDGQNVRQTVAAGNHLYMYAVWNEYSIYYSMGNRSMSSSDDYEILFPTIGVYEDDYINSIHIYSNDDFCGWNLYRREQNKWFYSVPNYYDDFHGWYYENLQPEGYQLHLRPKTKPTLGKTALIGDHLILFASWMD